MTRQPSPTASLALNVPEALRQLALAEACLARPQDRVQGGAAALVHLAAARRALTHPPATQDPASVPATPPVLIARLQLPARATSARAARAFCADQLAKWHVPTAPAGRAVDVANELVSNAVSDSRSPVVLLLELGVDELAVRVWDDGPGTPRLLPYRRGVSERGIGLRLVKQLSSDWGWEQVADGKWVWARLPHGAPLL